MKRYPGDIWGVEQYQDGRLKGHDKLIWGGEGAWDLLKKSVTLFNRAFIWESETILPPLTPFVSGTTVPRFVSIRSGHSDQSAFEMSCKRHFKEIKCIEFNPHGCDAVIAHKVTIL